MLISTLYFIFGNNKAYLCLVITIICVYFSNLKDKYGCIIYLKIMWMKYGFKIDEKKLMVVFKRWIIIVRHCLEGLYVV